MLTSVHWVMGAVVAAGLLFAGFVVTVVMDVPQPPLMRDMQAELQARRTKPFDLNFRLHLIDNSAEAHASLSTVLTERGFGHLVGDRCSCTA